MPSNVARHEFRQQLPFCNHENRTFLGSFGVLRQLQRMLVLRWKRVSEEQTFWTITKIRFHRGAIFPSPIHMEARLENRERREILECKDDKLCVEDLMSVHEVECC